MPKTAKTTNSYPATVGSYNKDFKLPKECEDIEQKLANLRNRNEARMQIPSIRRVTDRVKYACKERGIKYESFRKAIGLDFPSNSGAQVVWRACPICPPNLRETTNKDDGSSRSIELAAHCLTAQHLHATAAYLWVDPESLGVQKKCPIEGCERWFSRNKAALSKHVWWTHSAEYLVSEEVRSDTDDFYIYSRGPTRHEGQEDRVRNGGSHIAEHNSQPDPSAFGSASSLTTRADRNAIRTEGPPQIGWPGESDRLLHPSPKPPDHELIIARFLARLPDSVSITVPENTYKIEYSEGHFEFDDTDAKFLGFLESIMDFLDKPSDCAWFQNFDFSRLKPTDEVPNSSQIVDTIEHGAQSRAHLQSVSRAQKSAAQPAVESSPLRPFGGNAPSKSSPTREVSANAAGESGHRDVLSKREHSLEADTQEISSS